MNITLLISELNGKKLYEPKTIFEVEHILGDSVVLLKEPHPELGLGCVINVFRTVQALNIGLEIGTENDNLNRTGFVGDFLFKLGHLT